jgi:hypothetical protein
MGLVTVGVGRLVNPLLLFALVTFCFIAIGVLERREYDEPEEAEGQSPAVADTDGEGSAGGTREDGEADGET